MAEMMKVPAHRVRVILRSTILQALTTGGSVENMRKAAESSIIAYRELKAKEKS
jgi:hypothetical protein